MAWYIYTGGVPVPVRNARGEVVVVKPRTKVETEPQYIRKYKRWMRPTSPPRDPSQASAPSPDAEPQPVRPLKLKESVTVQSRSVEEIGGRRGKPDPGETVAPPPTPEAARKKGVRSPSGDAPVTSLPKIDDGSEPKPKKRTTRRRRKTTTKTKADDETSKDGEAGE